MKKPSREEKIQIALRSYEVGTKKAAAEAGLHPSAVNSYRMLVPNPRMPEILADIEALGVRGAASKWGKPWQEFANLRKPTSTAMMAHKRHQAKQRLRNGFRPSPVGSSILPSPSELPDDYLEACVREARVRVDKLIARASQLEKLLAPEPPPYTNGTATEAEEPRA